MLTLLISKFAGFILKILHRGSNYPGVLALKLNKKILKYFKMPKIVVAVTGSAGKGSTSSIIAEVLRKSGYKTVHNKYGSNMLPGILTLLITNSSLTGKIKADAVVVEVDERYTKKVFDMIKPNYVVITNICRDQPPRHGHFDKVFEKIDEALTKNMKIVLNADDPYLQKFNLNNEYNTIYFGINKNKLSYKKNKFNSLNICYCPKCNNKLDYNYYHIETLGDYYCSKCDFKKPNIDFFASKIDLDNKYMIVNNSSVSIQFNVLYYAYNILAAYSVCSLIGIDETKISEFISEMENNKKLNDLYKHNNKNVYIMNNKAENATTFNESVLFTSNKKVNRTIVIGWKEISRRYLHNDMSWLYDIEFELLNDKYTKEIICVGRDRYNIALRLKYAGFKNNKIKVYKSLDEASDSINKSKNEIFAILNFDYVEPFKSLIDNINKQSE